MENATHMEGVEDRSVPIAQSYGLMLVVGTALILPLLGLHRALHGGGELAALRAFFEPLYVSMPLFFFSVCVHEAIHAATWIRAGRGSWADVRFGVQWKTLTPFAHCTAPLTARAYRWGVVAPGLALGVVPAVLGSLLGIPALAGFGWMLTFVAAGDALVFILLRGVEPDRLVRDHPERAGCVVLPRSGAAA